MIYRVNVVFSDHVSTVWTNDINYIVSFVRKYCNNEHIEARLEIDRRAE